jgi:hypothetical protein
LTRTDLDDIVRARVDPHLKETTVHKPPPEPAVCYSAQVVVRPDELHRFDRHGAEIVYRPVLTATPKQMPAAPTLTTKLRIEVWTGAVARIAIEDIGADRQTLFIDLPPAQLAHLIDHLIRAVPRELAAECVAASGHHDLADKIAFGARSE